MKSRVLCIMMIILICFCACAAETKPSATPTTMEPTTLPTQPAYGWYCKISFNRLNVHESITCEQDVADEINELINRSVADGYLEFYVYTDLFVNEEIFSAIDYFELVEGVFYTLRVKHECIEIEKLAELAKEPVVHKILIDIHPTVVPE